MSTDSTELTFVRCPSCRSLVPASQTRCRMCGASLEASGKGDEAEKQAVKSSRVKQRTMSVQQGDVAQALTQAKEDDYAVGEAIVEDAVATSVSEPVNHAPVEAAPADPLGPYIEELSAGSEAPTHADDDLDDLEQDDYDFLDDDASDLDDFMDQAEDESPKAPEKGANGAVNPEVVEPFLRSSEPVVEPAPLPHKPEVIAPVTPAQPAAPQVRVESGSRKQSLGLSFGRGNTERRDEHKDGQKDGHREDRREERREEKVEARERVEPRREHRHEEKRPEPVGAARSEVARPPQKTTAVGGRLYGWLVSYQTPDGVAVELREGKYFVSRTSLKTNDFVVNDDSVSTPHALINISVEKGFQVQDLMSERGVFIRRRQGDTYQKEDMATVQHGDWVRFGDVEFLVSLVAHVGMK